jgi:hypothetical protein
MPKKSLSELKTMLVAEKMDALAAVRASKLSSERTAAMDYYNGDMNRDMPPQDGRSKAVSSDVADTIEGLMPSLMEIFAGSDDVMQFNPVGPQDVQAAVQETDYVNHVFMQQNPGFLVLYSFIKDALLSKVGIVKVWWEDHEEQEEETYYDIPDDGYALLAANPDIEIVAHSAHPAPQLQLPASASPAMSGPPAQGLPPSAAGGPAVTPAMGGGAQPGLSAPSPVAPPQLHDVTVATKRQVQKACVEGVPPEEFGISRFARSLRDCGYCFHEVIRREEDLIADGYDPDQIKAIPTYAMLTNPEELSRDTVDEHLAAGGDEGVNEANRQIKITEHYVRMDYEGNNKPALYMVVTGGDQGEILRRDGKEVIEQTDVIPFAAMTPFIVTHRFFGRSVADLVMDIQRVKTAILRGILDNVYLANNPRVEVSETHATDTTLDDLLVSRPGGIVRTKMPGGVNWQEVPSIAAAAFPVIEYMDSQREWRTGVSHVSQGIDAEALQNQSATAAAQVYSASQAKMKLIARIFAETGIKDLFLLLHAVIRKNGSQAQTVKLRNQWTTIDPRDWKKREDMTVQVGLGSGGKTEQMQQLQAIINLQAQAVAAGKGNIVSDKNLYNSGVEFAKLAGRKDFNDFFTDPATVPAPQPPPDPKLLEIQMQGQLQDKKQQTDAAHQQAKMQADAALAQQKFDLEAKLAVLEHELTVTKANHEMALAREQHGMTLAQGQQKMQMAAQPQQPKAAVQVSQDSQPLTQALGQLGQHLTAHASAQTQAITDALKAASAPRRIVRGPDGKVSHVESIPAQ